MIDAYSDAYSSLAAWRSKPRAQQLAELAGASGGFTPDRSEPGSKLRLGILAPCLMQGGTEAWALALARSIDPEKIICRGIVTADGGPIDPAMQATFETLMPVGSGRANARILAAECDILVTTAVHDLPGLVAGLPLPPRTVAVSHAPPDWSWSDTACRGANPDRWAAVSQLAVGSIPSPQRAGCRVILNGVDETRLVKTRSRGEMHAYWGVPLDHYVAGFYQRCAPEKDPGAAIRLARSLPPGWTVVVVGPDTMGGSLRREAEAMGLDNIKIVGADPRSGDVLRAFDVLVSASRFESFGLSMAEAIMVGTPLVATEVGIAAIWQCCWATIPFDADGATLANACLQAIRSGAMRQFCEARFYLRQKRFGDAWTEFLCGLTLPLATKRDRVNACKDRGSTLPLDPDAGCCGGGAELNACRAGKGKKPGAVSLRECLACVDL